MAGLAQLPGLKGVGVLAQARGVRECLQFFSRERQWINEVHLEVCRIPAPTFLEQKRAEWVASQLRGFGWDARLDRAGNVVAWMNGAKDGPLVALTAHLDTVLAPRGPEEITVEPDGRFVGPGVADNGAGLAALLAVGRALKSGPPIESLRAPLLLVANVGEEGEGNLNGMRFLCRQSSLGSRIRAFLVLDGPGTDQITSEALASRRFEITINGPGGHSWTDFGAPNPVHALARAIALFTDRRSDAQSSPRSSFNFGLIDGGSSVNAIPSTARAKLDLRSENWEKIEELAGLLGASVERALEQENSRASSGKATAKIREIGSRPGGRLPEGAPILQYLKAVDSHLAIRSQPNCSSTDANIPLSMGLPAVSIGAGGQGGGAHTPTEWFRPEGRELALQRILLTLCLLMREADGA